MKRLLCAICPLYALALVLLWWQRWSLNAFVLAGGMLVLLAGSATVTHILLKEYQRWSLAILAVVVLVFTGLLQAIISVDGAAAAIAAKTVAHLNGYVVLTLDRPVQNIVSITLLFTVVHWWVLPRKPKPERSISKVAMEGVAR